MLYNNRKAAGKEGRQVEEIVGAACVVVCITSTSLIMRGLTIAVIALLLWGIRRVWVHKEEK